MIRFECSECNKKMSAPPEFAGKKARCPHCKERITVPGEEEEIIEAFTVEEAPRKPKKKKEDTYDREPEEEAPPRKSKKKKEDTYELEQEEERPPPPKRKRRYDDDDEDDDDDRPRKKKKKTEGEETNIFFWACVLLALVTFGGLLIAGIMSKEGAIAMLVVGAIPTIIGTLWLRSLAWSESYGEYMACLYVPFYDTIFALGRWDLAWAPCVICWIGRVFIIVSIILLGAIHRADF
jgi:hypothetical protein